MSADKPSKKKSAEDSDLSDDLVFRTKLLDQVTLIARTAGHILLAAWMFILLYAFDVFILNAEK